MALQMPLRRGWRPHLDPRMVRRDHALARLAVECQGRLATVIAGPGWGKTTVLAQLARELSIPVAWCQLREADANVTAFALGLADAIADELPGFGADVARHLAQIPTPAENWAAIARLLASEIADTLATDLALVLDDYHLVAVDDAVNRLLGALVELLPGHVHFIVAARQDLPPALARVYAATGACRVDEDDLRFGELEGVEYLHRLAGDGVALGQLDRLVREVEGWPLGLTLLAEHLRTRGAPGALPTALPTLFDYLSEEALRREPPEMQELLLAAAVPERFSPALLRHVLGREVVGSIDELGRRHLFLTSLEGEWYRFHHLFRAYLRWKAERTLPLERRREVQRRVAAAWHALGDEQEAVRHELAGGDFEAAAYTLARLAPAMIATGQWPTLQGWLEQVPPSVREGHPMLLFHLANCAFVDRRLEECRSYAGRALAICERQGDDATFPFALELLIRSHAGEDTRGDHLAAVGLYERYRARFSYDYPLYAAGAGEAACALAELDRFAEADDLFRWAFGHPAFPVVGAVLHSFSGFYLHLPLGHLDVAFAQLQMGYDLVRERDEHNFRPFCLVYRAIAHFQAGHYDDCRRLGAELMALAEARGMERTFQASMAAILGLIALDAGRLDEARAQCAIFEGWRERREHRIWGESWGDALLAGVAAAEDDADGFVRWADRAIASARAQGSTFRYAQVLTELARLALGSAAVGRAAPHLAADLLDRALEAAGRIDARYSLARAHLLLAAASAPDAAARAHLDAALQLSEQCGYEALWLRHERARAKEQLARAVAWRLRANYVQRLRSRLHPEVNGGAMAMEIVTLGRFAVSIGGEEIDDRRWGRPKVKALFKYLLTAPNQGAQRDVLIEALWPDLDADAARGNLNNAVYRLRRALEPGRDPRQGSRFLVADGSTYRLTLHPRDRWDAATFPRRAAEAQRSGRVEDLAVAAALYGGEYLPDDIYEDWAAAPRERLRGDYERLLQAWAEALARQGELARAIEVAERLLRLDPTLETAHRALMGYYAAAGERDRALRQYRRCQAALQRAIAVEPDAETTALYRRILQG